MAAKNPLALAIKACMQAYEFRNSYAYDAFVALRQLARHLAELGDEAADGVDLIEAAQTSGCSLAPQELEAIANVLRRQRDELSPYRLDGD